MPEKTAQVNEGKLRCPQCGSDDLVYVEEVTNEHAIRRIEDMALVISAEPTHTIEEADNERLQCGECGECSNLPEGYATNFEQ
jgi:ribosomal protein S27AE